ncbi:Stk1 family PASTA domain-containing Ser/Thr kinase [Clostridium sp. SHJSY1]|uniref:Stk1 family PASTA domain-containing Ser/Thr kinase n=1 Tax=Clostridium sp. SHJSY1 TaxID=2942483 RepID=UPI002875A486|nr:Stk1 family PASTA domain-containing Ser/Thr kinase [Clostridium sp. SHJSY1]MDS0525115.1 Stk1 family PASTA domain-containing Ser/Thr kinase [Clostridium sp. SHJSY1]
MIGTLLLNRYEILEKLGEGGMGVVYKARCNILNRFVTIKVLKKDVNNSKDFITRFKREANSVASLSHPNIVNIHDVGYEDDIHFLVMEYIDGKSLSEIINENNTLSPGKAVDIALQLAKALEIAHRNNIIHRDIKPDNILITKDNIVKLMDFGIAKVTDSVNLTSTNIVVGSVHYLSPEQGKGDKVDCRSDLYSLGIVMYQMLIGQVPFKGENSVYIVLKHINEPVIPPKNIIADLPDELNAIILKLLEKDPDNRFQTAKDLIESLNEINDCLKLKQNRTEDIFCINPQSNTTKSEGTYSETVLIDQEEIPGTMMLEKVPDNALIIQNNKNSWINKNKKKLFIAGVAILAIFLLIIFIPKKNSNIATNTTSNNENINTKNTPTEKENKNSDENGKKKLPSVIGKKQDVAKKTISDNGFSNCKITNEYNDVVPSGYVIKQSPAANTALEKDEKITLVISKGPKKSDSKKDDHSKNTNNDNEEDDNNSED